MVSFSREIYIEKSDFMENPPRKYFRLKPEGEVRLKGAYIIKCESVVKDENGEITEIHCTYDPETKSGCDNSGKKVKGTIHWVNANDCMDVEVRLYDYLFEQSNPYDVPEGTDFIATMNKNSLEVKNAKMERIYAMVGEKFQFMRTGYFCVDRDSENNRFVFNRIVSLKDSWKKQQQKQAQNNDQSKK